MPANMLEESKGKHTSTRSPSSHMDRWDTHTRFVLADLKKMADERRGKKISYPTVST